MQIITIVDVFDSNVPNIDNGKIWIDINKLWQITGLENQASYFIVKDDFNKAAFPYWKFKSKESLLKNLKELIDQKKQVNHLFSVYFWLLHYWQFLTPKFYQFLGDKKK